MLVIPVLDILGGKVVAARGGDRDRYRPIETPLAPGQSDPVAIAEGFLRYWPGFTHLYIADLDAIAGRWSNARAVARIAHALPDVQLLVDEGATRIPAEADPPRIRPVLGTETLETSEILAGVLQSYGPDAFALSLDWKGKRALGPKAVFANPGLWPDTLIVMTLAAVGSRGGPDFARVGSLVRRAGGRRVLAAGGVRHREDLCRLERMGAAGALVATALHEGALGVGDLAGLARISI